jgi:hypothetical protein
LAEVTVLEAARCLGISPDTVRRRISTGELKARKEINGKNFTWWVEVAEDLVSTGQVIQEGPLPINEQDGERFNASSIVDVQTLLDSQASLIATLKAQVQAQQEELESRRREVQELHVLLQQAQAALPVPQEDRHSWWRRLWHH